MKTTVRLSIFCLLSMLAWGCNLINPSEELPGILIIDEYSFSTTYNTEYSASENITEVWVFANDQVIGAFDLPAQVPVLGEGVTQIKVYPGIKNNGIGSTRDIYPFYEVYIENIDLQPLKVDTIRPVFKYVDNAVIVSVDDFETSNAFIIDDSSEGSVIRTTDPDVVFEGDGSGHLKLTAEENLVRVTTNEQQYELPSNRLIYLEMDYRCDNSMAMGLFANTEFDSEKRYILVLNPTVNDDGTEYWNKVYIAIDPTVALTSTFDTYEVFFESSRDQDNDSEINVYIDNVKLVYFP